MSYQSSKDPKVLEYICSQIFHWFIDEDSKMNPNLEFAQTKRGIIRSNSSGIIEFKDIYYLLGAIKLIQSETASMLNINDLKIIGIVFIIIFISGLMISSLSTYFAVRKYIKLTENKLYN